MIHATHPRMFVAAFLLSAVQPLASLAVLGGWLERNRLSHDDSVLLFAVAIPAYLGVTAGLAAILAVLARRRGQPSLWGLMAISGPAGLLVVFCLPSRTVRPAVGFPVLPPAVAE